MQFQLEMPKRQELENTNIIQSDITVHVRAKSGYFRKVVFTLNEKQEFHQPIYNRNIVWQEAQNSFLGVIPENPWVCAPMDTCDSLPEDERICLDPWV